MEANSARTPDSEMPETPESSFVQIPRSVELLRALIFSKERRTSRFFKATSENEIPLKYDSKRIEKAGLASKTALSKNPLSAFAASAGSLCSPREATRA